jgi:hypothetical protein
MKKEIEKSILRFLRNNEENLTHLSIFGNKLDVIVIDGTLDFTELVEDLVDLVELIK